MSIGEKISNRRKELGLTLEEVGNMVGVGKSTVLKWENGYISNMRRDKIALLAKALQINPTELIDDTPEPSNISDIIIDDIYKIPVFESVSAGFGSFASSEIIDYLPMVIKNPAEVPDTLAIVVSGDSMYPKIEDGDIVVVRKQDYVDSGSIAVVIKDNEDGLVKKIEFGKDYLELISINPMYPPQRFERSEMNRIRVVGLVKKIVKSL